MPVRRNARKKWIYRTIIKMRDGSKVRIFGTPEVNTKEAALEAERDHIDRVKNPPPLPVEKEEVPTFAEWFWGDDPSAEEPTGRFWDEWVIGRKNKPGEAHEKKSIYRLRLKSEFGNKRLDEIGIAEIARFRAKLVKSGLHDKTINNTLAVLSKPLHYAADVGLIKAAPKVGLIKIERPEFVCWEIDEYARILEAAKLEPEWYAGVCLAGEAGLRVGEIRALRWKPDVDLVARTITVNQQIRLRDRGHAQRAHTAHGADDGDAAQGAPRPRHDRQWLRVPKSRRDAEARRAEQVGHLSRLRARRIRRTRRRLACPAAQLRNACGALRGEPVDAHALDGSQADRRDDAVRQSGRQPSPRARPAAPGGGGKRTRSGSPDRGHARVPWHPRGTRGGVKNSSA
jgi:integrase